jgi:hypothetical protein
MRCAWLESEILQGIVGHFQFPLGSLLPLIEVWIQSHLQRLAREWWLFLGTNFSRGMHARTSQVSGANHPFGYECLLRR